VALTRAIGRFIADLTYARIPAEAARIARTGFIDCIGTMIAGREEATRILRRTQGFLAATSQHGDMDREGPAEALGREWRILSEGLSIKKYPTCYCTHRAIDGALALFKDHPVQGEEVGEIRVAISDRYATILRNHRPKSGLEAKFSM
jgi:2-methylcitrate dehydratase PrpD